MTYLLYIYCFVLHSPKPHTTSDALLESFSLPVILRVLDCVTENTALVRGSVTPCLCLYIGAFCPSIYSSPERQKQRFRFVTDWSLYHAYNRVS